MAVKLVALDIDGTVLPPGAPPDAHPSPRLAAAVARLRDAGVAVVLASGRMFPGTVRIARAFGLDTPVVCQQGCSVHRLDGVMLHEFPIERAAALQIVDYARERDYAYEWFNPVRYLASRPTRETIAYGRVSGISPEYRDDPERSGIRPTGVGVISSPAEASLIHRELVAHHGDLLHVLDFPAVTVAVDRDANKGHALALLCRDFGVAREDVVAIGDSVNDAPMLAWAGHGVAVGHCDRYARDAADEVLPDDVTEPVATWLETLVPRGLRNGRRQAGLP
ncbi:MAG: HAD family phosphatase [Dehalococcoidia bacterium]|nr:HAD family phosphatase [Dehalococcoidia bacterium]